MVSVQSHRKDEHISLAKKFHSKDSKAGFDQIRFVPNALPESDIKNVNISTKLGKLNLTVPFYIEAMTGGSKRAKELNYQLANIAKNLNLAMAVGSESVALREPELASSFSVVKEVNPHGIKIANLSANASISQVKQAIQLIDADAIEIHINAVQEIVMPEGDRKFNWINNIKEIVAAIDIPVIVKEVGFGIDQKAMKQLSSIGVQYVNVGGTGGTNFAKIENFRRPNKELEYFSDWGLSTVESLLEAKMVPNLEIVATGGIKNPLQIVKALYLGANAVGIASEILNSLIENGPLATQEMLNEWILGVKSIYTVLGVNNVDELRKCPTIYSPELIEFLKQRKIKMD